MRAQDSVDIAVSCTSGLVLEVRQRAIVVLAAVCARLSRLDCFQSSDDVGVGRQPDGFGNPPLAVGVGEAVRHRGSRVLVWNETGFDIGRGEEHVQVVVAC